MIAAPAASIEAATALPGAPFFDVRRRSGRGFAIDISGAMQPGWMGNLAMGLSGAGVNILSGEVRRLNKSLWRGELNVEPPGPSFPALNLGDLALGQGVRKTAPCPARLRRYDVRECFRQNGSVYVEIEGYDSIGFLGAMLDEFSSCGMFPWDITINTNGGRVYDKFHLMGAAALKANHRMIENLRTRLNHLTS